ncbi:MAG: DUF1016 family protein, partial [Planctomycetes bacterium]|nr:DUF1016 family protein [Planctomycetota bacterium]
AKQAAAKWGSGFLPHLSKDLTAEFPEMKGFSLSNLKYMKQWYLFYSQEDTIGQQSVAQLAGSDQNNQKSQQLVGLFTQQPVQQVIAQITQIPWGHNIVIITKCKNLPEALYYAGNTLTHNWSRSVLVHQIESGLYKHVKLHCYVVVELKTTKFQPEDAGKLNFYLSAVDDILRTPQEQPTIDILICNDKTKTIAEYALRDVNKPMGVSEYQLTEFLPENLKSSLPSVEEIEAELGGEAGE